MYHKLQFLICVYVIIHLLPVRQSIYYMGTINAVALVLTYEKVAPLHAGAGGALHGHRFVHLLPVRGPILHRSDVMFYAETYGRTFIFESSHFLNELVSVHDPSTDLFVKRAKWTSMSLT